MTRTYAARRLLEHGPLSLAEFLAITGWPYRSAQAALTNLMLTNRAVSEQVSPHRCVYRLAA